MMPSGAPPVYWMLAEGRTSRLYCTEKSAGTSHDTAVSPSATRFLGKSVRNKWFDISRGVFIVRDELELLFAQSLSRYIATKWHIESRMVTLGIDYLFDHTRWGFR